MGGGGTRGMGGRVGGGSVGGGGAMPPGFPRAATFSGIGEAVDERQRARSGGTDRARGAERGARLRHMQVRERPPPALRPPGPCVCKPGQYTRSLKSVLASNLNV